MLLNDDELQRLEDFLGSDACGENALLVDEVHGLLSAVACSPEFIPPAEWLPLVYDGEPRFVDLQQAADVTGLLVRFYNEIVAGLNAGEEYLPLFIERLTEEGEAVLDAEGWCHGFIRGMSLRTDAWADSLDQELGSLLYPILVIAAEGKEMLESAVAPPFDTDGYQDLSDLIPDTVAAVYAYWHNGEGVGPLRSQLCPCGSGEPFDACCGQMRVLH